MPKSWPAGWPAGRLAGWLAGWLAGIRGNKISETAAQFEADLHKYGSFEAIIGCVAAGMGISLLPRAVLEMHLAAGTVRTHPTPRGVGKAKTLLVWHRERSHHMAREAFSVLLRNSLS